MHTQVCVWRSEDKLSVLSFHHVSGTQDLIQTIGKHLYPCSHLSSPRRGIFKNTVSLNTLQGATMELNIGGSHERHRRNGAQC